MEGDWPAAGRSRLDSIPPLVRVRDSRPLGPPGRRLRAASFRDVRLELIPEQLQRRQYRRRGGVAERAQRLAGDVVGDAEQQVDVLHLPFTALDTHQQLVQP